jgi:Na+/melibiose symporter-like transporter
VCLLICGFTCKERIKPADNPVNLGKAFKSLAHNKPAICLILMVVCINCFLAFKGSMTTYYCQYYLGNMTLMTPIMTLQFTTPLIGLLFVPKVVSLLGKKKMFIGSGIFAILSGALLLLARQNIVMICIGSLCCGLVVSGVFATIWGTMPDAADYGEWKTGVYCPGVLTAMATFATKLGSAIAQYGVSWVLTATGYDASLATQNSTCVSAIYASTGIVPIVLGVLALICIMPYDLTDEKVAQINAELDVRRANQ